MSIIKSGSIIQNPTNLLEGSTVDQITDRGIQLFSDAEITWSGTQLSFTQPIDIHLPLKAGGSLAINRLLVAASPITISNDQSLIVRLNRTSGTNNLASGTYPNLAVGEYAVVNNSSLNVVDLDRKDHLVLFRRTDSTAGSIARLLIVPNKQMLQAGQSAKIGTLGQVYDSDFSINDPTDPTKKIDFDAAGTTGTKTTIQGSQTTNKVVTLPDATDTLVGKATTDTLTNKTLQFLRQVVATDSTTTGSNATLDAFTTGIVRLTNVSLVSISGIPAGVSGQTLIIENNTGASVTVNNDDAGASASNRIYTGSGGVTMLNQSTFMFTYDTTNSRWMLTGGSGSGSGSGSGKNYLGTVNNVNGNGNFELGSTSKWSIAHSAVASNFLTTVSNAGAAFLNGQYIFTVTSANATVGATYTNNSQTFTVVNTIAAGTLLVCTGTGAPLGSGTLTKTAGTGDATITFSAFVSTAASGNLSLSTVTSGKLAGTYSASLASSAATTTGDMLLSDAFTIDIEDQAKVLGFKFYYSPTVNPTNGNWSGTSSNSFAIAIYDVTNAVWIQPAGVYGMTQSSGVGICSGTFQTSSNGTQYQIAVYNANATSGAITVLFDDVFLGPQIIPMGAVITDGKAYTPIFTGFGTVANVAIEYRQVGDTLEIYGQFDSGTATASLASFSLPPGLVSNYSPGNGFQEVGRWVTNDGTATHPKAGPLQVSNGASVINFTFWDYTPAIAPQTYQNGNAVVSSSNQVQIRATIKIVGLSSNVQMSHDTDTRAVASRADSAGETSTTFANGVPTKLPWSSTGSTTGYDSHGTLSSGNFVVPVSGKYKVSAMWTLASASAWTVGDNIILLLYKNGVNNSYMTQEFAWASTSIGFSTTGSTEIDCIAGDILSVYGNSNSTVTKSLIADAGRNWICFERLSGPSVIAASESVSALYRAAPPTGTLNGSFNITTFGTKYKDSHNAYSSGNYTIPISGCYSIQAAATIIGTHVLGTISAVGVFVNGTEIVENSQVASGAVAALYPSVSVSSVSLLAGDIVTIRSLTTATTPSFSSSIPQNFFSITRTGNY